MLAVTFSLLSLKSSSWEELLWVGGGGRGRSLPLSVSLSLLLAPSYIMGKQERREEEKCGTAASDL